MSSAAVVIGALRVNFLAYTNSAETYQLIGVGRGGGGGGGARGPGPLNNLKGGGANIPFGPPPPNNPPTFSFNFYVKQEKLTNVPI